MVSTVAPVPTVEARTRSRFFLVMAIVLLVPVVVGFGPTFFLRPWFAPPNRYPGGVFPTYLAVHGVVLTGWCLLLIAQSWLVSVGKAATHRRLGVLGIGLAAAVVAVSLVTMAGLAERVLGRGVSPQVLVNVIPPDTVLLASFVGFLAAALWLRRRPAAHKRLMLFAGLTVIGPAFAGARPIGRLLTPLFPAGFPPITAFSVLFMAALVMHDIVTRKRPHSATMVGVVAFVGSLVAQRAIGASPAGVALVEFFGRR